MHSLWVVRMIGRFTAITFHTHIYYSNGALQRCYKRPEAIPVFGKKMRAAENFLPLSERYLNKSMAQVSSAQLYWIMYSP